jgi:micrococcal nuclease
MTEPTVPYFYRCRAIRAIDGDTVVCDIDLGLRVHVVTPVRLIGVNAPELHRGTQEEKALAAKALAWMEQIIKDNPTGTVQTSLDPYDKYGRVLGRLVLGGVDVNAALIENGFARLMT